MATVTLEGVRKIYPDRGKPSVAVHQFDLAVADGEFVVLVGPSGCGKSTTLRMIAGLESISEGTLRIGERVVNDVPARDRDIAMVFQNYALYPHMTVHQNLAFALTLRKLPRREVDARVRETADLLGLREMLDRRPRQLSGGQRQRVALGRAIVRQPQVFLFDEPLSNLDAKLRVQMRREIAALRRRLGTTTIYVTHDQVEALTLGDRIVVMRDGRGLQVDTPSVIYQRPADTFVATFIGSPPMNLLRGRLVNGVFHHESGDFELPIRAPGAPDQPVIAGLRPEAVRLVPPGEGAAAEVNLVEPLGSETLVTLGAGSVVIVARVEGTTPVKLGDRVGVSVASDAVHWFDAVRETRIS